MNNTLSQSEISYPSECLRGIPSDISIEEAEKIDRKIFRFTENKERPEELGKYKEMSVTWNDSDEAVRIISQQQSERRDGFQFPLGFVVIKRSTLDILKRDEAVKLRYERYPIEGNEYHGNILISSEATKTVRRQAAAELAHHASVVFRNTDTGEINITSYEIKNLSSKKVERT